MGSPLHAVVEIAFNRYLALDPEAEGQLKPLEGRMVGVELSGTRIDLYFLFTAGGVKVFDALDEEPDTLLRGSPAALARLAREGAAGAGTVEIRGDVDLARRFENLLGSIEIDWEEQLSHLTGDAAAHHLARTARGLFQWAREGGERFQRNVADYLREESRLAPRREEMELFSRAVETLRDDVERLEARLKRLGDA